MGISKPEVVVINGPRNSFKKPIPPAIQVTPPASIIPEVLMNQFTPDQQRQLRSFESSFSNDEKMRRLQNGLADVIGYSAGFPMNQGTGWTAQLSNPDTIFYNLRWFLVSNFRQMLSEAYMEIGLVQTICVVPVEDALRGGVDVTSKQLSAEQIEELQIAIDRDNILTIVGEALIWNRLYGGAGILTLVGDQAPDEPYHFIRDVPPDCIGRVECVSRTAHQSNDAHHRQSDRHQNQQHVVIARVCLHRCVP